MDSKFKDKFKNDFESEAEEIMKAATLISAVPFPRKI